MSLLGTGLLVREHAPDADAAALERLALWLLQRVAPIVAVDPPDGIAIDSTRITHLHGGEPAMLEALIGRLTMSGIAARVAVADSLGAAHALARHAAQPTWITPPGHDASGLAFLPLVGLRPPAALVADLRLLGFEGYS